MNREQGILNKECFFISLFLVPCSLFDIKKPIAPKGLTGLLLMSVLKLCIPLFIEVEDALSPDCYRDGEGRGGVTLKKEFPCTWVNTILYRLPAIRAYPHDSGPHQKIFLLPGCNRQ